MGRRPHARSSSARSCEGTGGPFHRVLSRLIQAHPVIPAAGVEDAVALAAMDWWERFRALDHPGMLPWIRRRAEWRLRDVERSRLIRWVAPEDVPDPDDPTRTVERAETARLVLAVLGQNEIWPILVKWASGWTAEEIAREAGVSAATVRKRVEFPARLYRRERPSAVSRWRVASQSWRDGDSCSILSSIGPRHDGPPWVPIPNRKRLLDAFVAGQQRKGNQRADGGGVLAVLVKQDVPGYGSSGVANDWFDVE